MGAKVLPHGNGLVHRSRVMLKPFDLESLLAMHDPGIEAVGIQDIHVPVDLLDSAEDVREIGAEEIDGWVRHY